MLIFLLCLMVVMLFFNHFFSLEIMFWKRKSCKSCMAELTAEPVWEGMILENDSDSVHYHLFQTHRLSCTNHAQETGEYSGKAAQ